MKFSIIIPVYNAQETLQRCLDSIMNQSYPAFEVLMVDDGSIDKSAGIASYYTQIDPRFILIQQSNLGPSCARNRGIELASGDVISFVDSDDYIEPDYLQQLHFAFTNERAQVVFFDVKQIEPKTSKIVIKNIPPLPDDVSEQAVVLSRADVFGYTWIKALTRKAIGNSRFDESLNLFEDEVFTCEFMRQKPAVSYINKPLYNYVVTSSSLSRIVHPNYYKKCEAVYIAWKKLLSSSSVKHHEFLQEKANHMTNVCKWYFLEKKVPPFLFARGLSECTFFQESSIDDMIIASIKNQKFCLALGFRMIYLAKAALGKLLSR